MKVAICFYGQPRLYKQVLPQWSKIISDTGADVFIHTWYGIDRGKQNININELILDFSPKELQVSNPHKFVNLISQNAMYANSSYHAMNQAYTLNKSLNLLNNYSIDFNQRYDIVIRCRFDIVIADVDEFIRFIKNDIHENVLYVSGNHWEHSFMFDDNIMVAQTDYLTKVSVDYFKHTIEFINKTDIIPGGEQNNVRIIDELGLLNTISKTHSLDFKLIPLPINEIILNQNER